MQRSIAAQDFISTSRIKVDCRVLNLSYLIIYKDNNLYKYISALEKMHRKGISFEKQYFGVIIRQMTCLLSQYSYMLVDDF